MRTIALLGGEGGPLRELADVALVVPSADTQHVQAVHVVLMHLLCELVEERLVTSIPLFAASSAAERATSHIAVRRGA
jgi:DNA-binding MurR/RpiR family transcriptional regulator